MRGLSKKTNDKSPNTCSFCRNPSHQVTKCPHVPIIWGSLCKGVIPLQYMKSLENGGTTHYGRQYNPIAGYLLRGENWGDLYKIAQRANDKYVKALEREALKKKNKGKKNKASRKATQTCGFCGEKGHTRRGCSELKTMQANLEKANSNFRQWFYNKYVSELGLSTGCIVEADMSIRQGYGVPEREIKLTTIVTDINWKTINLFSVFKSEVVGYRSYHDQNLGSNPRVGGTDRLNNILSFIHSDVLLKIPSSETLSEIQASSNGYGSSPKSFALPLLLGKSSYHLMDFDRQAKAGYSSPKIKSLRIVSRAPQVLSEDWTSGYSDEMSVIFKKFNKDELDALGITKHISEWADNTTPIDVV